jgi:hypothetical protein
MRIEIPRTLLAALVILSPVLRIAAIGGKRSECDYMLGECRCVVWPS